MRAKTGPTAPAMVVLPPLPCPPEAAADGYSQPPPAPRQGDPCSATASCPVTRGWPPPTMGRLEGRVAQEQNIPGEVFLPLRDATKCRTKRRHFMANKAQIYCCNSLGRWQSGEESFCPLPILVGMGVDFQQGDQNTRPPDSNLCTHLTGTGTHSDTQWLRAKNNSCKITTISSQWNCRRFMSRDSGSCLGW